MFFSINIIDVSLGAITLCRYYLQILYNIVESLPSILTTPDKLLFFRK
ncbi:hypothetical protein SAMN05216327_109143 [Dyadobacter sp. SG02]|nr:hypothetical protein SAMN05216327_109143 [Dyadobacter sp. SG02]